MYTIQDLCERSGLSRSTLLYYDSIGILPPSARSESNYRLYSDEDLKQLDRICTYKEAGVSLEEIGQILSLDDNLERAILEKTLIMLNKRAREVRLKQDKISEMLQRKENSFASSFWIDKDFVLGALQSIGYDSDVLLKFHEILENESPDKHKTLLSMFGFSEDEAADILGRLQKNDGGSNI